MIMDKNYMSCCNLVNLSMQTINYAKEIQKFLLINLSLKNKTKAVQIKKSAMRIQLGNKQKSGKESKSKWKVPLTLQTLQSKSTKKAESLKIGQIN